MTDSQQTIMELLKKATWDLHQQAEASPVEQKLIKGTISRPHYAVFLEQRYLVHKRLDAALRKARQENEHAKAVVHDYQFHTPEIEEDLRFYGVDPNTVKPTPGTKRMAEYIDRIERENPVAVLGIQYVLEGSTNGARFIARAIRMAFGLQTKEGTRYLDPYGEAQRQYWGEFRAAMEARAFTDKERDAIIDAARQTFITIIDLEKELETRMEEDDASSAVG